MLLGGLVSHHWANTNLPCIKLSSVSRNCCGKLFSLTCSLKVAGYLMIFKMIQFISITVSAHWSWIFWSLIFVSLFLWNGPSNCLISSHLLVVLPEATDAFCENATKWQVPSYILNVFINIFAKFFIPIHAEWIKYLYSSIQ